MSICLLALLTLTIPIADDETWPGFRGDGTSRSTAKNVPLKWSPTENIAWRVELPGYGQSAPVVWKNSVFVTTVDGENKETYSILAVDAKTGERLWKKDFAASQPSPNNAMMSRAAPTPLVDSESVYAFFEGGDMVALNHDGKLQWERSFVKDYGKFENRHGLGEFPGSNQSIDYSSDRQRRSVVHPGDGQDFRENALEGRSPLANRVVYANRLETG